MAAWLVMALGIFTLVDLGQWRGSHLQKSLMTNEDLTPESLYPFDTILLIPFPRASKRA